MTPIIKETSKKRMTPIIKETEKIRIIQITCSHINVNDTSVL